MPLFKSFRSKSRKSSFTSVTGGSTAGAGVTETGSLQQQQSPPPAPQQSPPPINNDLTPAPAPAPALRTGTTTSLEKKKSKLFSSHSTSSRRKTSVSQEPPARPSLSTNISTSGQLFNNDSTTTASPPLPASFETGPRPSELFASKASQWSASENTHQKQGSTSSIHHNQENQLSPSSSSVYNQDSAKSDDLQNFLKARRQWVPTFVTEFKEEPEARRVDKPDDIAFSSGPTTGSLMSLKDLDESHQRKQRLLGGTFQPTTGSDWLGSGSATGSTSGSPPSLLTSRPTSSMAPPPPSSAARAIALTSIPASTITGGPPIHPDSSSSASRKSGSISRKPAPSVANKVNGHTNGNADTTAQKSGAEDVPDVPVSPPPAAAPLPTAPGVTQAQVPSQSQVPVPEVAPSAAVAPAAVAAQEVAPSAAVVAPSAPSAPSAAGVAAPVDTPARSVESAPVTRTEAATVATEVTNLALHATPSATTGGYVDASQSNDTSTVTPTNGNGTSIATPNIPFESPRYNPARESMETSGGMFETPAGSAPPSEAGHGQQLQGSGGDTTLDGSGVAAAIEKKVA